MRSGPQGDKPVHAPSTAVYSDDDEDLPVTSFACQWKEPRKRKESTLKFADADLKKHVYGRERKHHWKSIKDFDPQPVEHRGSAPQLMQDFLRSVKGKGLGVSVLFDKDLRFAPSQTPALPEQPHACTESRQNIVEKVASFKQSLHVTAEKNTRDRMKHS